MRVNFFWADTPMPWIRYMTLYSLKAYNPDVQIRLYTDAANPYFDHWESGAFDATEYDGPDWRGNLLPLGVEVVPYDSKGRNPCHAGDLCRWEVLARGGIFADMDIVWLRPFTEADLALLDADAALSCTKAGHFKLGLCASRGPSEVFEALYEESLRGTEEYHGAGPDALYRLLYEGMRIGWQIAGPDSWDRLQARFPDAKLSNIPVTLVHPLEPEEPFKTGFGVGDALALHWYAGSALGRGAVQWEPHVGSLDTPIGRALRAATSL